MLNLFTPDRNGNKRKAWAAAFDFLNEGTSLESTIDKVKIFEENNMFSNILIFVATLQDLKIHYTSKNIQKILGYTQDQFKDWESCNMFEMGSTDQPDFYPDFTKWGANYKNITPHTDGTAKLRVFACGNRWKHKDGSIVQLLLRVELYINEFNLPQYCVIYQEDVTHLLKGNDYWLYFESSNDTLVHSRFYKNNHSENKPLTARETEILKHIATGKSSKEVASELGISVETVSQHRKHMIKKMMARDTSSLIQLCKICEII